MEFKVNGRNIKPAAVLNVEKVLNFINNLSDGELIDTRELSKKFNYKDFSRLRDKVKEIAKDNYVYGPKRILYYGNIKTIKEYKRQVLL